MARNLSQIQLSIEEGQALLKSEVSNQIMTSSSRSIVTYHRENFEMAVESKSFVIQRLGIKDYPPIFAYAESFYAIICNFSFFLICL